MFCGTVNKEHLIFIAFKVSLMPGLLISISLKATCFDTFILKADISNFAKCQDNPDIFNYDIIETSVTI